MSDTAVIPAPPPAPPKPPRGKYVGGQPFYGEPGKPNRKASKRLAKRRAAYDDNSKSPGGHQMHRPGSMK